jgi:hypothetical protein
MHSLRLWQSLAVAVALSLVLLIAGMFGLGMAIRHGVVVPPTLDLRYALVRITAYRTHYADCPPSTQCPPQSVAPPQEYYVVWSMYELPTAAQRYGRTARRLMVVPLSADVVQPCSFSSWSSLKSLIG